MDDLAVHREEYSPFSSCLAFDSSELDLYLHPAKSSPQADHHLNMFPGNHNTTHSHQQPKIAPFLLSSSHGQFIHAYSSSAYGTDSSDTTWKSNAYPSTLNMGPDAPYTYEETDELKSDFSSVQNNVKHEPELSVHDVEDLVTESISEETPNPIDKLSFELASEELPRSNKTKAFEPEKEEEEQISPEWTYDRDPEEEEEEQISLECTFDRDPEEEEEEQISPECTYDKDPEEEEEEQISPECTYDRP